MTPIWREGAVMNTFPLFVLLFSSFGSSLKIAFVGDTGIDGDESSYGYGHRTFDMIVDQGVDLVVDVGDFEYWGRCTEEYSISQLPPLLEVVDGVTVSKEAHLPHQLKSMDGNQYLLTLNTTIHRYARHDGKHGSQKGWQVGVKNTDGDIQSNRGLPEKFMISDQDWKSSEALYGLNLLQGARKCYGEPWDGPWIWRQFLRDYGDDSFDFLGSSGNAEVKEAPLYGSAEIWKDHQRYMYELYNERIVQTGRGRCRGYDNPSFPGTVEEYGERFSCFYGKNNEHHIIFLGWWQGSDERGNEEAVNEQTKSVEFIENEFGSSEEIVKNTKWRYCVQHMTSAKLSAGGGPDREHMELAAITDACRRHGAIIFSGHHHLYSRTKMLENVGGANGDENITVAKENPQTIQEGRTMSITVGMGGYDGNCDGKYKDADWMQLCVASLNDHRGAVIAEFDDANPQTGNFTYLNSLNNSAIVDQFILRSKINLPSPPSLSPSLKPPSSAPSIVTNESIASNATTTPTNSSADMPFGQISNATDEEKGNPVTMSNCSVVEAVVCQMPMLSNFCTILKEEGMDKLLRNMGELTLFAPISSAFDDALLTKLRDNNQLIDLLLFHVANGTRLFQDDLVCGGRVTMSNGKDTRTICEKDSVHQKGAGNEDSLEAPKILQLDVAPNDCNVVVHLLDQLLLPFNISLEASPLPTKQPSPTPTAKPSPSPTKPQLFPANASSTAEVPSDTFQDNEVTEPPIHLEIGEATVEVINEASASPVKYRILLHALLSLLSVVILIDT